MKYSIGIDLGGTHTAIGLVDAEGNIAKEAVLNTTDYEKITDFVDAVAKEIAIMANHAGGTAMIDGIGVGAPTGNYRTGCLENPANLPWKGITALANLLQEKTKITTKITNDANAAAMGEMLYGAAKGLTDFILITIGTGVGAGVVSNGELLCGPDGMAGELGHIRVDNTSEARPCGCGRKGCLETYCSASGIVQTAHELGLDAKTSKDVYEAACRGDEKALETFRQTGRRLGNACADFAAFTSPQAFIFFGGPMHAKEFIMPYIEEAYNENVLFLYRGKARMLVSELMDRNAAVLGAAAVK